MWVWKHGQRLMAAVKDFLVQLLTQIASRAKTEQTEEASTGYRRWTNDEGKPEEARIRESGTRDLFAEDGDFLRYC